MRTLSTPEVVWHNGVPMTHFEPLGPASKSVPTIFVFHGWASSKENYEFIAEILSHYGYRVIVPDAPLHGERQGARNLQTDFWKVVLQSVEEFGSILDFANEKWGVTPEETAIVGSSMGGFVAPGIFSRHANLNCLVSINGSGAWEESERVFRQLDGRPPASDIELAEIRKFDPLQNITNLPIRPVLLQHGDSDTVIPVVGQRKFYEHLSLHYGEEHGRLINFQEVPRLNHYISLGMFEFMFKWIDNHLGHRTNVVREVPR